VYLVRKSIALVAVSAAAAALVVSACVGDDPAAPPSTDAGADTASPADSSTTTGDSGADSSVPADGGVDGAKAYDVRALPGLRLWLESGTELEPEAAGSTGFGAWADLSGRWDAGGAGAPDGGRHTMIPHNVNPPSIVKNAFGSRPTVSFIDGNGWIRLENHDDFLFGLGELLVVEVAKVTAGAGPLFSLRPTATAGSEMVLTPGSLCVSYGIGVNNGCTTPAYTPSTEPHVFAARRKSDVFTLRVDGSVRATLDRTADPPDLSVRTFQQPYIFIGNSITMQVSEVIVLVGPTSDSDLAALEAHLKAKYAIP
jgi:hypothetical protein